MAKYPIIHSCSHPETLNLVGPKEEREARRLQAEKSPCWDCEKESRYRAALQAAELGGLPPLKGLSIKQKRFAEQVRIKMLDSLEVIFGNLEVAERELVELTVRRIRAQVDAGWWLARKAPVSMWEVLKEQLALDGVSFRGTSEAMASLIRIQSQAREQRSPTQPLPLG